MKSNSAQGVELAQLGRLDHRGDALVALVLLRGDRGGAFGELGRVEVDEADGEDLARVRQ